MGRRCREAGLYRFLVESSGRVGGGSEKVNKKDGQKPNGGAEKNPKISVCPNNWGQRQRLGGCGHIECRLIAWRLSEILVCEPDSEIIIITPAPFLSKPRLLYTYKTCTSCAPSGAFSFTDLSCTYCPPTFPPRQKRRKGCRNR